MSHNSIVFLRGLASGMGFADTMRCINVAEELHEGQFRRGSGEPYINHATMVACELAALGMRENVLLGLCMVHDTREDCGISEAGLIDMGVSARIAAMASVMDKRGKSTSESYDGIREFREPTFAKISDRCHNISTMAGAFTAEKMLEYIRETEEYVIPLCRFAKRRYPENADAVFAMKYHIESVCRSLEAALAMRGTQE